MVCQFGIEPYGRVVAGHRNDRAFADQLFRPLHVRQRDSTCYRADPGVAGRGLYGAEHEHAAVGAVAFSPARHHGHHHAVRYRSKPGLLWERLSTFCGLLAARSDLRVDLSRRIYGDLATLGTREGLIGDLQQHESLRDEVLPRLARGSTSVRPRLTSGPSYMHEWIRRENGHNRRSKGRALFRQGYRWRRVLLSRIQIQIYTRDQER